MHRWGIPRSSWVAAFVKELTIREGYALLWLETLAGCHLLGNLCKCLVTSLCNHTSEVWYSARSAHSCLGSKFSGTFTRIVVKVYNLCRVKTDISVVLMVMSGLDPHIINKLKDGYKSYSGYFLWLCWVPTISVLTLTYCCSEEKVYKDYEDDVEF